MCNPMCEAMWFFISLDVFLLLPIGQTRRSLRVQQHDCVFLGGDFNFRCNASPQETLNWIKSGQWNELLLYVAQCVSQLLIRFASTFKNALLYTLQSRSVHRGEAASTSSIPGRM